MKGRTFPPLVAFALGAALSFYVLAGFLPAEGDKIMSGEVWIALLAAAVAGAGVTFAETPSSSLLCGRTSRGCRAGARLLFALGSGFIFGLVAIERLPPPPSFGFPDRSVTAISGLLAEDPRRLENGTSLLVVKLLTASDAVGRRASASGRFAAFSGDADLGAIRAAGKGSLIAIEGTVAQGRAGPVLRARSAEVLRSPGEPERRRNALFSAALSRFSRVKWGGLAAALLLGNREGLDDGEGERYAKSGCAHVLSLSGMHLAVISALVALVLKKPLGLRAAAVVGTLLVSCYVFFVGFQPALTRSVIMYGFGAAALLGGYPRRVQPLLAAAFIVQLVADAESARSTSFVLSYLALFGIALLGSAADDLSGSLLPRFLRAPIATSIGAFLATAAVCAATFGSLRPIGIIAGLLVAPAVTCLMIGALVWFILDLLVPTIAAAVAPLVGFAAEVSDRTVGEASRFRGIDTPTYIPTLMASLAVSVLLVYGRYRLEEMRNRVDPFD